MVVELRSGTKVSNNNNVTVDNKKPKESSNGDDSKMTSVVFIGLLMDLLAFTLILPLFPSLLDHYKKHDGPDGLFHFLDNKVKSFGLWIGVLCKTYFYLGVELPPRVYDQLLFLLFYCL